MRTVIEDLKDNFRRRDNSVIQLILINVIVFIIGLIIYVGGEIIHSNVLNLVQINTYLPAPLQAFIKKPWTLFTYFFAHADIFHIFFNMLAMYFLGRIVHEFLGNRRVVNIYILGGLFGGILYLILFNTVPYFIHRNTTLLVGASGSVIALGAAAATLAPNYPVFVLIFGPFRLVYVIGIMLLVYFVGTVGSNSGGNVCHLGGALLGYLYVKALQKGTDLGQPINYIGKFIRDFGKPKMKVSYRNNTSNDISQKEVDAILDKISRSGYNSLTKEEKQKLFNASQK